MAPHSSTLAWKIPWIEEPGRLKSMGSLRVGHDWANSLSLFTFMHGEGNGNPLQCSCLENPRDGGAWWASVYGVAQSRTRLKQRNNLSEPQTINLRKRELGTSQCNLHLVICITKVQVLDSEVGGVGMNWEIETDIYIILIIIIK